MSDSTYHYQVDEVVTVNIASARVSFGHTGGDLMVRIDRGDGKGMYLSLPADLQGVTIRRAIPADGAPKPGEIWADRFGENYFAVQRGNCVMLLTSKDRGCAWFEVHRDLGPISRVWSPEDDAWRPPPAAVDGNTGEPAAEMPS